MGMRYPVYLCVPNTINIFIIIRSTLTRYYFMYGFSSYINAHLCHIWDQTIHSDKYIHHAVVHRSHSHNHISWHIFLHMYLRDKLNKIQEICINIIIYYETNVDVDG